VNRDSRVWVEKDADLGCKVWDQEGLFMGVLVDKKDHGGGVVGVLEKDQQRLEIPWSLVEGHPLVFRQSSKDWEDFWYASGS
jgi:hypothetical protein